MHEYSLIQALLDRVDEEAERRGATAVHRLHLRIGELSGVEIPLLRTAFEMARAGSICADAELEIEGVPARWQCTTCGEEIPRGQPLRCPICTAPATLAQGGDLFLESLEMEVP